MVLEAFCFQAVCLCVHACMFEHILMKLNMHVCEYWWLINRLIVEKLISK